MRSLMANPRTILALAAVAVFLCGPGQAQDLDVQAQVEIAGTGNKRPAPNQATPDVVVWLKPDPGPDGPPANPPTPGHFRMAQKNKSFQPHLLVIPLGSTVAFPNLDPFFHNVFSQFNGKRFDLGLYEAGSTKDVKFNHEGVSYIFCNIHPEMSAVIVTMTTPWWVVSRGSHTAVLHQVPAGAYTLHVWAEGVDLKQLEALTRHVHISAAQSDLGTIQLTTSKTPPAHKNKFGDDYRPDSAPPY
jgi:hypothetical protein